MTRHFGYKEGPPYVVYYPIPNIQKTNYSLSHNDQLLCIGVSFILYFFVSIYTLVMLMYR